MFTLISRAYSHLRRRFLQTAASCCQLPLNSLSKHRFISPHGRNQPPFVSNTASFRLFIIATIRYTVATGIFPSLALSYISFFSSRPRDRRAPRCCRGLSAIGKMDSTIDPPVLLTRDSSFLSFSTPPRIVLSTF